MKKLIGFAFFLATCFTLSAQDSIPVVALDEVLIYSGKFEEKKKNLVQKIEVINASRIRQLNSQNTGDLLMNTGNVFIQKSQQGGSSPVIRGFEASRVLLVIDGIRMNNAIYRSGHLQNVITVDQNMLERVEVLFGPSSTIYGSDALGGVVHLRTKSPLLSQTDKNAFSGSAFTRYSSVNNEKTVHADFSLGGKKFGWLQSYNFSDFDDMKLGDKDHPDYPGFGRRKEFITTINGMDSIVKNDDDRVQKFSGYRQWDITQKFLFAPGNRSSHLLNLQYSNSSDVPRYDRLQDIRNGKLRYAEWYYGPQQRFLASYEFNSKSTFGFNEFRTNLSYQDIEESRHQRNYRSAGRDNRMEKVKVAAINIDGRKLWTANEITVGIDVQFNDVKSEAYTLNINDQTRSPLDTRYPDGDNKMILAGIYAQHLYKFGSGKWVLNDGIRVQATSLKSNIVNNSFLNFPVTSMEQKNTALTGNLGLVFMPDAFWRINGGLSTGFRSPNIDDLAKIFESNSDNQQLVIPNPAIEPEYTYNADFGVTYSYNKIRVETGVFYTKFDNAITIAPFSLNGQDSILYDGAMCAIMASQNVNKGKLYGFYGAIQFQFTKELNLSSSFNYSFGSLEFEKDSTSPLDHIPPTYGRTAINYTKSGLNLELYAHYNGWKRIEDYSSSGEDNSQYATVDGTPAWFTLNLKSSFSVNKNWLLQFGVENILDRNYRLFASGFSSAGRNFVGAVRYNF